MKRKRRSSSSTSTPPSPSRARSRSTASNNSSPRRRSHSPIRSNTHTSPRTQVTPSVSGNSRHQQLTYSEPTPTRSLRRANGISPAVDSPLARPRSRGDSAPDDDPHDMLAREPRQRTPEDAGRSRRGSSRGTPAEPGSEIRRSGRQRKPQSYTCSDDDYAGSDDAGRHRRKKHHSKETASEDEEEKREVSVKRVDEKTTIEDRIAGRSPDRKQQQQEANEEFNGEDGDPESPFFNHVRFSPSAKPGSPAVTSKLASVTRPRSHRSRLRRVRLHNVPSDDEQSEFNRRYSRDLRTRRKHLMKRDDEDDEVEDDRPVRRSARMASITINSMQENSLSEFEDEEDRETVHRRGTPRRRRRSSEGDQAENSLMEVEDTNGLRRSSRTHKPIISNAAEERSTSEEEEEEEDEDMEEEVQIARNERPKRSRLPVERLNYQAPQSAPTNRRCSEEIRNLDQYSTDEEFTVTNDNHRRRRYNMRENRQKITRFAEEYPDKRSRRRDYQDNGVKDKRRKTVRSYKDSSSSSSSDTEEERFQKRKSKRMNIERSKLMPVNLNKHDVSKAIFRDRQKVGSSLADVLPMEMDLNIKFESVGGCQEHINSLKEMVVFPLIYPEVFSKFSITPPRGVLFYGPPGTGKTLMARALASESSRDGKKVAFFMRKGADCLSKWIGESERQLRLLFDQAYVMRPSIIFFDEIDGLAPVRSSRQDQIHSSIVSTLLALMDGLDNRGEIIVIGATNRIENIDPALRRPGRFDRELRFGLPTRNARKEILQLHTKSWKPPVNEALLDTLADKTIGYCGADIKGLGAEAALNALKRRYPQVYKTNQKLAIEVDRIEILEEDFFKAMKSLIPSTHRVQDQNQSPLPAVVRPLLNADLAKICQSIDRIMPIVNNDGNCHSFSFRPRMLIHGDSGQGLTTYLGPAVLHYLEKIPCYKLDIPALFSNSVRTPEEALFQIFHEAKRTMPSCIYMPHIYRLFKVMNDSVKETFLALLGDILPNSPLLLLAVMEEPIGKDSDILESLPFHMFSKPHQEIYFVDLPSSNERKEYFMPLFQTAVEPVPEKFHQENDEDLPVLPVVECRSLTEQEEKRLQKRESKLQRELRIFLRDIWAKINREQKFFMFRVPVDTEEVYDYLETVKEPMDFDKMLTKLDNEEYKCAQAFLDDIDLISENAIAYNSDLNYETNKIICHRARALQDFCYAMVKAEMDTDFEDECKEIVSRREKLAQELSKPLTSQEHVNNEEVDSAIKKKRTKKKVSNWAKGEAKGKKRLRRKIGATTDDEEEMEEEDANEEEDDEEAVDIQPVNGTDEMVPMGIRIDQSRLNHVQNELVLVTENFSVEKLERVYSQLMDTITSYKFIPDRTQLPKEIQHQVDSLKTTRYPSRN